MPILNTIPSKQFYCCPSRSDPIGILVFDGFLLFQIILYSKEPVCRVPNISNITKIRDKNHIIQRRIHIFLFHCEWKEIQFHMAHWKTMEICSWAQSRKSSPCVCALFFVHSKKFYFYQIDLINLVTNWNQDQEPPKTSKQMLDRRLLMLYW